MSTSSSQSIHDVVARRLIFGIAVAAALLHLYYPLFGVWKTSRVLHLMAFLVIVFLAYPLCSERAGARLLGRIVDAVLIFGALAFSIYPLLEFDQFILRAEFLTDSDIVMGVIGTLVVLEAVRRAAGMAMVILSLVCIIYAFLGPYMPGLIAHKGAALEDVINIIYVAPEGLYGLPVAVMSTYVFLFIIFGALLETSGGSAHIIRVADAMVGNRPGGPAKIAVFASGMMGSISGSSVANVATTGAVTIPMMTRTGLPAHVAAGIEAVASTGGMIMPPIMGAVAFIMSEMVGLPYLQVIIVATIPAFLFYFTLYVIVHLEARKRAGQLVAVGDPGVGVMTALAQAWWVAFPILILVVLLVMQYSAPRAVVFSILSIVIVIFVQNGIREGVRRTLAAFDAAARATAALTVLCAAAGIVISMVYVTGIGVRFSSIVLNLSGGNEILALLLVAAVCIVLGMGLPVTAAYLTTVAIAGPAMQQLGFSAYAVHMFVIFYAVLSSITPPFCMASYTAAGIAGSHVWRTAWWALKYGLTGFIIPFLFVFSPALLILGSNAWDVTSSLALAVLGLTALAGCVVGFMSRRLSVMERGTLGVAAASILCQQLWLTLSGSLLYLVLYIYLHRTRDRGMVEARVPVRQ